MKAPIFCFAAVLSGALLLAGCEDKPVEAPYEATEDTMDGSYWTGNINGFGYALVFEDNLARLYITNDDTENLLTEDYSGRWEINGDQFYLYQVENDDEPLCTYQWNIVSLDGVPTITLADSVKLTRAGEATRSEAPGLARSAIQAPTEAQ